MRSCICCSSTKGTDDSQFWWKAWTRVLNNVAIISSVRGAKVIDVIGQMKLFCIWDVLALASPICAQHTLGSIHPLRPSNKWVTYFCQLSPLALSLSNGFALTSIKSEVRHWQTGIGVCVCVRYCLHCCDWLGLIRKVTLCMRCMTCIFADGSARAAPSPSISAYNTPPLDPPKWFSRRVAGL